MPADHRPRRECDSVAATALSDSVPPVIGQLDSRGRVQQPANGDVIAAMLANQPAMTHDEHAIADFDQFLRFRGDQQ